MRYFDGDSGPFAVTLDKLLTFCCHSLHLQVRVPMTIFEQICAFLFLNLFFFLMLYPSATTTRLLRTWTELSCDTALYIHKRLHRPNIGQNGPHVNTDLTTGSVWIRHISPIYISERHCDSSFRNDV